MTRRRELVLLAALLVLLVVLVEAGAVPLLAWTDRVFPVDRYRWLFAIFFGAVVALEVGGARHRRSVLLAMSLALGAVFSVEFLALSLAWFVLYHRVLYARVRARWKLLFVLATYAAWAVFCNRVWFPALLRDHPELATWGYVFAVGYVFRVVWVLFEAGLRGYEPEPLPDFLVYFLFGPFFIIVPYMLAIPRPDRFRGDLSKPRPDALRRGLVTIAYGTAMSLAVYGLDRLYQARMTFVGLLRDGEWAAALPAGVLWYPCVTLCENIGAAAILIGLCRVVGFDLSLPFDRPLLSQTVTEWWRRWNTHLRELLVDIFYYPVVLRFRRRRVLGMVLGCVSVFVVGSTLLHLPKHYFGNGTHLLLPVSIFWENVAMCALVAGALWLEMRRGRQPPPGRARFVLRALRTVLLVFFVVVAVGNRANYVTYVRPVERLAAPVALARSLAADGRPREALRVLAPHRETIRAAVGWAPRDPARHRDLELLLELEKEVSHDRSEAAQ